MIDRCYKNVKPVVCHIQINCKHNCLFKVLILLCETFPKYGKGGYVKKYHFLCELLSLRKPRKPRIPRKTRIPTKPRITRKSRIHA